MSGNSRAVPLQSWPLPATVLRACPTWDSRRVARKSSVTPNGDAGPAELSAGSGAGSGQAPVCLAWPRGRISPTRGNGELGILTGYAAWMAAALIIAHYALPSPHIGTWVLVGCSGVLATLAGIARNRPAKRLPWLVLAQAGLCAIAGQCAGITRRAPSQGTPVPAADGFHLLECPLDALGIALITRANGPSCCRACGT
jgi:hypothetical protein